MLLLHSFPEAKDPLHLNSNSYFIIAFLLHSFPEAKDPLHLNSNSYFIIAFLFLIVLIPIALHCSQSCYGQKLSHASIAYN